MRSVRTPPNARETRLLPGSQLRTRWIQQCMRRRVRGCTARPACASRQHRPRARSIRIYGPTYQKKKEKNDVSKLVNPYAKVICLSPMHPRALDAQRTCFPRRRGFSSNNLILASCTFLGIFPNARRKKEKNTGDFGFSIVNVLFICEPAFTWL